MHFFPPLGFFKLPEAIGYDDDEEEDMHMLNSNISNNLEITPQTKCQSKPVLSLQKMDQLYDECKETKRIFIGEHYVDFTKHFKYLGSFISYHLRDDYDIEQKLSVAYRSMGALHNLWKNPHVDLYSKYQFFMAIPLNLLLWGCEAWALKVSSLKKLEVFLHKSIRRILGINILQVQDERKKN